LNQEVAVDKFIIKLFGVNHLNFWGWIGAGLLLLLTGMILLAAGAVSASEAAATGGSPEFALVWIVAAIAVFLLGIFGVLLQIYTGLLAEKLEKQHEEARRREREDRMDWPDRQGTSGGSVNVTDRQDRL
jgi:hypothetical protein